MSKIEKLIEKLCPDGVEFKELGQLGFFYGGLTGKTKADFAGGNAKFITYMNVFSNLAVDTQTNDYVKIGEKENQNEVEVGDVLFTGSSETPDECGMSSVLTQKPSEPLYLNSFCFGFRLDNHKLFLPDFLKYLFRSEELRKQIGRTASGVTRFNISKKRFEKIIIPVPPLEVQSEIARILGLFTELEAELESELEARKAQYKHYRDKLLTFNKLNGGGYYENVEIEWKTLGEIAFYPKRRISAELVNENSYVGVENLLQNRRGKTASSYVPAVGNLIEFIENDVLIGNIRPYLKKIWFSNLTGGTNGDVVVIRVNESCKNHIIPKFLYYALSSDTFFNFNMQFAKGAKMPRGDKDSILKFPIPIPPLSGQERIVSILDKFDALVNDISTGLPAEITARRQQYEHYRNKLLRFKKAED